MSIPNLNGFADPENVSSKPGGFSAQYINWSRTLHDIRENAPDWMPEMVEDVNGQQVHKAPDGTGYLMIQFRHEDGRTTTAIPHAIMDHKMKSLSGKFISSRDISDSFVRGACKSAAALFGYAWQMWSKDDPLERTAQEDEEIAEERARVKEGAIKQTMADIENVGNEITDQHGGSISEQMADEESFVGVAGSVTPPSAIVVDDWKSVEVHFGTNIGKPLGDLNARSLEWYQTTWSGKGKGQDKPSDDDLLLRSALDKSMKKGGTQDGFDL